MRKMRGFTLLELLIVVAIAAILIALAAPSFTRQIRSSAVTNSVNSFMADLRFARSEAIRRGGGVIMCRSDAPEVADPRCNTGAGTDGNGWVSGWIIFHDLDATSGGGTRGSNDPLLRVHGPITNINSIVETSSSPPYKYRFTATGRLLNLSSATELQFGGNPEFANDIQRMLCINVGGRARIAGDGTASCAND